MVHWVLFSRQLKNKMKWNENLAGSCVNPPNIVCCLSVEGTTVTVDKSDVLLFRNKAANSNSQFEQQHFV